jgi:AAHS family 4-hydroxybenzoate transporter-like MFS transporter
MASIQPSITISEVIDQRPLSRFQLSTIFLCGLVLVLDGFATQSIGFLAPSMADSVHVSVRSFGPVFSAALVGLMLASLIAGPIADRIGRKIPIIVATLTFAIFTIATAQASTFHELVVLRFLTGLGLGAAIPNAVALTAEYVPKRMQQSVVAGLFCSMPLGALLGGLVSLVMLPRWGWQSVFYVGGLLPLAVALALIWLLPESIRFLSAKGIDGNAILKILSKIAPDIPPQQLAVSPVTEHQRLEGLPVVHLFTGGRAVGTVLLWVPFFMNLLMLYFIISWLPALLRQTHMPPSAGIIGVSIFSFGGILGSLLQGRMMNARGKLTILLSEFGLCLVLICSLAFVESFPSMIVIIFLLGFIVQGAQGGLNAIAAMFYPTSIRSTGVGWALGVGRVGSIVGPVLGGLMITRQWSLKQIFFAGGIPALLASIAIVLSTFLCRGAHPYSSGAVTQPEPITTGGHIGDIEV